MAAKDVGVTAKSSSQCVLYVCRLDDPVPISLVNTERQWERRIVAQDALKSSRIRDIETVVGMSSNGSRVLQIGRRHSGVFLNTCRKSGRARFLIRHPVTWG